MFVLENKFSLQPLPLGMYELDVPHEVTTVYGL